ncbi:DsbA family oxidoreductase [Primorskyibacter sp. S87]|uniref:DsbA family oxidoreductase n=1 Tax=Primorskyibacter sp. S87 TaxID=3415126 RepID=UPI003C7AD7F7
MSQVRIAHFSDVLCIWAYAGQRNLYQLIETFGDNVVVDVHFCSVFPDTQTKISKAWRDRGGFEGYGAHVQDVAAKFDGLTVNPSVWTDVRPRSSASPHLFIKAIELMEQEPQGASWPSHFTDQLSVRAAMELRAAFFADAQDISNWAVQRQVCDKIGLSFDKVLKKIETGEAIARLAADYELGQSLGVQGSPTYLMNEGRQKLYGNVGYGILEANISGLLREERSESASSCT